MTELIKITEKDGRQLVSARDLHKGLELTTRFSKWVDQNFSMFVEGIDFTSVTGVTVVNNGAKRELQDYALTVNMAKELSMMSQTLQGQIYRRYFITIEDKWNSPMEVVKRGYSFLMRENEQLKLENEQLQGPARLGQAVSGSDDSISVGNFAKVLRQRGIKTGQNRLFDWLRTHGYLIAMGKRYNSPTQRAMELGIMEVRETVITTNHGSKTRFTPLITGKGQQYFANKFLKSKSMVKEG
ncbi:phage antirepressor KilAC domain-containing protein [Lactiplantibacillus plantarum]|uniref:phage antirepressor KilAC domain-containing protein n=1 Tax=Lactiplantibacillus plantarum TaxID=1590 RepID=UPI00189CB04E|nr:phage antirepressor KilAC domain-containing protein [Lactiplantibacillus plantarum]MDB7779237.1 phage antirepressor KilAC domain-containing protein [Lactiplantibacillus plantarum]MDB7788214.1 phage antirepressor KilAC domain-containing protein [Lactiplantibacillus plantarum]